MQKNNKQMWYGLFGFQMMIIVMFLWFGLNDNIKLSAICGDRDSSIELIKKNYNSETKTIVQLEKENKQCNALLLAYSDTATRYSQLNRLFTLACASALLISIVLEALIFWGLTKREKQTIKGDTTL